MIRATPDSEESQFQNTSFTTKNLQYHEVLKVKQKLLFNEFLLQCKNKFLS